MLGLKLNHINKGGPLKEQGKSEGFDSCDWPRNLTQIEFKSSIFRRVWTLNLMDDHAKQWYTCSMLCQALCIISKPSVISTWSYTPEMPILGQNRFFVPCDLEIRRMALKNNRAPFYATLSFVHYFIAIGEFKLLQSGNNRIGPKSDFFVPCDLEIWRMILKNNRAHLLCYFKLCESFHSYWWIQTGATVRKRPNWDKICFDLSDLDLWPLTLNFCMDNTLINGNNSRKNNDDTMSETLWKSCDCRTDRRTDWWKEVSQLKSNFTTKYVVTNIIHWTSYPT